MQTQVFKVDPNNFDPSEIAEPARILAEGGLVAFPTETVYGIAASASNPEAVHKLRELKGRPKDKPFSMHISNVDEIGTIVESLPAIARPLMDLYWPGPLTLIFPGSAGSGIGVRLPSHRVACELVRLSGGPLVAPSANFAGETPAINAKQVLDSFDGLIDAVIDSGTVALRQASTVVRLYDEEFEVLREGIITEDMIRRALRGKTILFVCTGNSCRSPMAEALFKIHLAKHLGVSPAELPDRGFRIGSAGVQAFSGGKASQHAIDLLAEKDWDLTTHRTRSLTRQMAEDADLMIALSPSHRWQIVQWDPDFADKIETISETGIQDPIGGDLDIYRKCAQEIERAIESTWINKVEKL